MSTLYYAGPLFTNAEREWNTANAVFFRARLPHMRVLVPQEFCAAFDADASGKPRYDLIAKACLDHLAQATVMLAVLDGADADSGTCFEAGWAVARNIPVIGLRTDWRPAEDGAANCMLTRHCHAVVRSLDAAIIAIAEAGYTHTRPLSLKNAVGIKLPPQRRKDAIPRWGT